jgi:tryptophan synthase alpha chain
MGYQEFVDSASTAGVDGVLVVDMPPAESAELHQGLRAAEIDSIFLVAPTTSSARAKDIAGHTSGYLYYVSLKGVTGAALTEHASVSVNIASLRKLTDLPIVIGFGIKDAAAAQAMARLADGVIIGSALVAQIAEMPATQTQSAADIEQATSVIGLARDSINNIKKH